MINEIALILAVSQGQTPVQAVSSPPVLEKATSILGRMFAHYASAQSLSAHIRLTQTAMSKSVTFDTELAYERPNKIYFTQKKQGDSHYSPHLVSDGIRFQYSAPHNIDNKRIQDFKESVHTKEGDLGLTEIWPTVVGALDGGDDSFALEAMIARPEKLEMIRNEITTCVNKGKVQVGAVMANEIEGRWTVARSGHEGTYTMYVTDDGDLIKQQVKVIFAVNAAWLIQHHLPANAYGDGVEVTSTWDIDTAINKPVDEKIFKLP